MIKKETLKFFKAIQLNNNRPWFEKNKLVYEAARINYLEFVSELIPELKKIEPIFDKELKKYADRIYRDIRFSKDKRPYKNSISSSIERAPEYKKTPIYLHVQPGNTFLAGGIWQPESALLNKVRQEIDYNGAEFEKIINKKSFVNQFGKLKGASLVRPPKGYTSDHPQIELLKLKEYIIMKNYDDDQVCSLQFIKLLVGTYKEALPFLRFFDAVLGE
ncbi:MAG: DUF2461 domain-containing protein [Flavitalea sp.]